MSWQTLQVADLKRRFAPAEIAALQRAQADLDDSAAGAVLAQVTNLVRGYVGANTVNRLGAAGTIPETLVSVALDIAVVDYSRSVGGMLVDPKDHRKAARDAAIKVLQDVAANRFAVDQPDDAVAQSVDAVARPRVSTRTLTLDRSSQDGI